MDASSEGLVVIQLAEQELCLWNHDPLRLVEAADLSGGRIHYQARWRLLFAGGGYVFCAAVPPEEHVTCQAPDHV